MSPPEAPLPIGCEGENGGKVVPLQVREIDENLIFAHTTSEAVEHIGHREPEASDAWLSASLVRFDGDSVARIHTRRLRVLIRASKGVVCQGRESRLESTSSVKRETAFASCLAFINATLDLSSMTPPGYE